MSEFGEAYRKAFPSALVRHNITQRIVEAEGEHERYRYTREGLRYVVRAGTGTRVLFRVWRELSAIILCTELLCAYNDGWFVRSRQSEQKGGA